MPDEIAPDRGCLEANRSFQRALILSAARLGSSCSQTWNGSQPSARSSASFRRSRSTVAASLSRHHSALFCGRVECSGQLCQKQPSTNTAMRARVKTTSGRPGSVVVATRKRRPSACRARLSDNSGPVPRVGIRRICLLTCAEGGVSAVAIAGQLCPFRPTMPGSAAGRMELR